MKKKNNDWARQFDEEKLADTLEEEELDRLAAPKAMNSRKSMVPVHIYRIIVDNSSPQHHISRAELCRILFEKYELEVERKALARHLYTLADEGLGIICSEKDGVWYDPSAEW